MKKKKKKRQRKLCHNLSRKKRLRSAKAWLKTIEPGDDKKLVHSYRKRYGVSFQCTVRDLESLGVKLEPGYVERVLTSEKTRTGARPRKKEEEKREPAFDSDDYFAYIAGYTPGGSPFGITWDEVENDPELKSDLFPNE